MERRLILFTLAALVAGSSSSQAAAFSSPFTPGSGGGYTPLVPVSAFARPAAWFDPSRLHLSAELSFGTSFAGQSAGLQVTRVSYQFRAPLALQVSVGHAFGAGAEGRNPMFLEGLDLAYRPIPSMTFQVNYRNLRSPLQYSDGLAGSRWPGFSDRLWP